MLESLKKQAPGHGPGVYLGFVVESVLSFMGGSLVFFTGLDRMIRERSFSSGTGFWFFLVFQRIGSGSGFSKDWIGFSGHWTFWFSKDALLFVLK